MPRSQATVLMTCVGGELSSANISLLRSSASRPLRIVGADMDSGAVGRHVVDTFATLPHGSDPRYVDVLLDLCTRERVDVVLPGSDEEAFALSARSADLSAAGIAATVPPSELAVVLRNKGATFDFLAERGIAVPPYRRVRGADELHAAAAQLGHPQNSLVVKPAESRGGRGVWLLSDEVPAAAQLWGRGGLPMIGVDSLAARLAEGPPPELLVMEELRGEVYDVDVLSDAETIHAVVPRRRLNPAGIPFRGCVIEAAPALVEFTARVAALLGITGLYDLDVVLRGDGTAGLLEVNPRPSASAAATVAAGFPLVADAVELLLGEGLTRRRPPIGAVVTPSVMLHVDGPNAQRDSA